jgi:outer membrane receptor protein involved in Fe transport
MTKAGLFCWIVVGAMFLPLPPSLARSGQERPGSIRGVVYDKDFDSPLAGVDVLVVETSQRVSTTDQGNFVFPQVLPGKYTLTFTKDGYVRQVKSEVVVSPGQLTDVDMWMSGEFVDMDEFLVQDVAQGGPGSEGELLALRFESPALLDSIGAELMSRAGAGDAAAALRLVSGASVQDGKYAVVRGLPDRYVNSQLNGVRLPTADEDKRAVELDQYPAAVIESIRVSKTFTPDQQGDASGGAVDLRLKGIPEEGVFEFKSQISANSQVVGRDDFLGYDRGSGEIQTDHLGESWTGDVGVSEEDAPIDFKLSTLLGDSTEVDHGVRLGGFGSLFYEQDSAFFDDGQDNSLWVVSPGDPMTPQTYQGSPSDGDFKTALFDVTQSTRAQKWGGLGGLGLQSENHLITLSYLYTRVAEDVATLAEDTRGKAFFDPDNLNPDSAPYLRLETLEYTERTTQTLQLSGHHRFVIEDYEISDQVHGRSPELDWKIAKSIADMDQPDKRQFGSLWKQNTAFPDGVFLPYLPAANFNYGNLQRIWKDISEDSDQVFVDLKLPFEQWSEDEGYLKVGVFDDHLTRDFNQDTFSNFGDAGAHFEGDWTDDWSEDFPNEDHPILASTADVDYTGDQKISAWYGMLDLPLSNTTTLIGGARVESTDLSVVNHPEADALWFPPGATAAESLDPGEGDVDFQQKDLLPAVGLEVKPSNELTLRGSYSQTVARQTFKELTPILQQEYLGGPVFIGNPDLQMSALENYDLRLDYAFQDGGLISTSWFRKDVDDPIEYVQRLADFTFTTPVNYPEGELHGYEFEVRQALGKFWDPMEGFSLGANATLIASNVKLPEDEANGFDEPGIEAPMSSRDMTGAPDHLYNLYLTYDAPETGTQIGLFYTVTGDTLVAGATETSGHFVPNVYAKEYDTLNLTLSQKLGRFFVLQLQAKNLTNPAIEEVYRSKYIGDDVTKTSYTKGIEFAIGLGASFAF